MGAPDKGSADPIICVAASRKNAKLVPDATLLVLDGVGHELLDADVATIAQAIVANCARVNQVRCPSGAAIKQSFLLFIGKKKDGRTSSYWGNNSKGDSF